MKKIQFISLIVLLSALFSCEKFLDVQPKGTLTEDVTFKDIQGYRDAMYGVYATMAAPHLYGQNLSFDFVDKLGQMFVLNNPEDISVNISNYEYQNKNVKVFTDTIWAGSYTAISYVNNIIEHLKTTTLKHSDLSFIEGEAYALRAFLHYDIARLYTQNYKVNPQAKGIPYAYAFDLKNKKVFSLEDTYKNILNDLHIAEKLLEKDAHVSY